MKETFKDILAEQWTDEYETVWSAMITELDRVVAEQTANLYA